MSATVSQARYALEIANHRKSERVRLHRELKALDRIAARRRAVELLEDPSDTVRSLPVYTLLGWIPFLGASTPGGRPALIDRWYRELQIRSVDRKIGELSSRQLLMLIRLLDVDR